MRAPPATTRGRSWRFSPPSMRLAHAKVARVEWTEGDPASRAPMDGPFGKAVLAALRDGAKESPLAIPTSGATGPTYLFEQVLKVPMIHLPIANYDDNQHAACLLYTSPSP